MLAYLLDTNIVIYVIKRKPVEVLTTFNAHAARMAISVVTLAELLTVRKKAAAPLPTWPLSKTSPAG